MVIYQHNPHRLSRDHHGTTLETVTSTGGRNLACPIPQWGRTRRRCDVGHPDGVPTTQEKSWRAGRFWWDWSRPSTASVSPLRAVIFDLDALADIESDGHRVVFNAAFAAHGLDISWTVERYRQAVGAER